MKKLLLLLIFNSLLASVFAQENLYKKGNAVGIGFFLNDFQTAADIRSMGIVSIFKDHDFFKSSRMNPGIAINYLSGLSNHVDFIATLGGSFVAYPIQNVAAFGKNNLLLETTASVNLKLLTDEYWVVPFIDFGVGASKYKKYFGAFMPAGVGLQVNIEDAAYLIINSQYRIPVTQNASYHFYHSIGIAGNISREKGEPSPRAVSIQ
jgi:OmpA-OmpF porin, OOP family